MMWFEAFSEAGRLDRRQPVMRVMQQVKRGPKFTPQAFEQFRDELQAKFGAPQIFSGCVRLRRLVVHSSLSHAVGALQSRNSTLCADRFVPECNIFCADLQGLLDIGAARVSVNENPVA